MRDPSKEKQNEVMKIARDAGVLRPRDLEAHSIARTYLRDLCDRGLLIRSGRGLYFPADLELTERHSIAEVCKRVPRTVICLASALQFHSLTTQSPWDVWIMMESGSRVPHLDYPLVRTFRASGKAFHTGIEHHCVEGVPVQVYGLAKTIADCFRYRNKIGLDMALEALKECLRDRRCSREELRHFARIDRVERVLRPYLEALS